MSPAIRRCLFENACRKHFISYWHHCGCRHLLGHMSRDFQADLQQLRDEAAVHINQHSPAVVEVGADSPALSSLSGVRCGLCSPARLKFTRSLYLIL